MQGRQNNALLKSAFRLYWPLPADPLNHHLFLLHTVALRPLPRLAFQLVVRGELCMFKACTNLRAQDSAHEPPCRPLIRGVPLLLLLRLHELSALFINPALDVGPLVVFTVLGFKAVWRVSGRFAGISMMHAITLERHSPRQLRDRRTRRQKVST